MQPADSLMPILFKILIAFVFVNMLINFVLLLTKRKRIYKLLAAYWPCVLLVFVLTSVFQTGDLPVTLSFGATLIPLTIFSMIGFEVLGRKFPLRNYLLYYLAMFPVTLALHKLGVSFTTLAMPFSVAAATPVLHTFFLIWIVDRHRSTKLQKILGVTYFTISIHCINFALFRMQEGAQFWGWLTTYVMYDVLAVLLPSIALEEANLSENARLNNLVDEKTCELNQSLKVNESLLKVVLHDLSSPLMTMRFYLSQVKVFSESENIMEKTKRSLASIDNIILEVQKIYGKNHNREKLHLRPVGIGECMSEIQFIFGPKLEKKNISLIFHNQLSPETKILADQTTLTHSVLSNLISNGLKFSSPHSTIQISAREDNQKIILEVSDQGPGIPASVVTHLLAEEDPSSTTGTSGETGTGFGLTIVKSLVDSYGGEIEFNSRPIQQFPQGHGTDVRITLDRA